MNTPLKLSNDKLGDERSLTCSEEGWSVSLEGGSVCWDWCALSSVGLWESVLTVDEGNGALTSEGWHVGLNTGHGELINHFSSDDLHGLGTAGVLTSQIDVELRDSVAEGVGSVFLVHVDGISTGEVSEEDTVVLDAASVLLEDLGGGHDFTLALSNLVLALHEIPELRSSEDLVPGEHTHAVKLWLWNLISWQSSSNNIELSHLHLETLESTV